MDSCFFVILRRPLDSEETVSYFFGFTNIYDKKKYIETNGIEIWFEEDSRAHHFGTYVEAKSFLDVMNLDKDRFEYAIDLARETTFHDIDDRGHECGGLISLKTFYTTNEE